MTAKENLEVQVKRMWKQGSDGVPLEKLIQFVQVGIHFLVSAVMAGGILFGTASPFGVAMVGASGAGLAGGASLVGATFGYLTLHSFSQGLRYLSASILTFALWFCFYDIRFLRKPWVMASLTGLINGVTGFVYLNHGGWTAHEAIYFVAEILVTVAVTWGFAVTLLPLRLEGKVLRMETMPPRLASVLFGSSLLVSLSGVILFSDVSLGRILGVVVLLSFAYCHGTGMGAILGVSFGLSLDFASLALPIYGMTWGFSGMCAGFFKEKSRFHCGLSFLLGSGMAVLWNTPEAVTVGILCEVFMGTGVFFFVPKQWLDYCRLPVAPQEEEDVEEKVEKAEMERVRKQLEDSGQAFRMLGDTLKTAFRPPENQNDVGVIFDRTANKICQKCYQRNYCWEQEYISTFNAMNDATPKLMSRGRAMAEDFPLYFSHRCLHFPQYLEEVNLQLTGLLYRRQYNNRVRESRVAVCAQYGQLAKLLTHASVQISEEVTPQVKKAKKLADYLSYLGLECKVSLRENSRGLLEGEIEGEGMDSLSTQQGIQEISQLLHLPMGIICKGEKLVIRQLEPFTVLAGFSSARKEGELVSGDQSSYFKREDGKMFVLVCDGMGSGMEARGESSLASQLLEQFLKAGIETLESLKILSSALSLRGEDRGGFTTIDLLEIDLISGEASLYKYGAAPSYVRKGEEIQKLTGASLPAGSEFGVLAPPDHIKMKLQSGDTLLLISDGVCGNGEDDQWICDLLRNFKGDGVREFARAVLGQMPLDSKDDRTAVMVKIQARPWNLGEEESDNNEL